MHRSSTVHSLPLPLEWGTHHTKAYLIQVSCIAFHARGVPQDKQLKQMCLSTGSAHAYKHPPTHTDIYMPTDPHAHAHTNTQTHTNAHIHTNTHTNAHTYTQTLTNAHTYAQCTHNAHTCAQYKSKGLRVIISSHNASASCFLTDGM